MSILKKIIEANQVFLVIVALCVLTQWLLGVNAGAIFLFVIFMAGVMWLRSERKFRALGTVFFTILLVVSAYYVISVEIMERNFPVTSKIKDRWQKDQDVTSGEKLNPNMVQTKRSLLDNLNKKQDSLAKLIDRALDESHYDEASTLMDEQIKVTEIMKNLRKKVDQAQTNLDTINQNSPQTKARVFQLKKGQRKTLLSFPDKSRIYYESSGDFSVVERKTYQYSSSKEELIGKTAGVNFHDFAWRGSAVVVAEEDITIKAWF